jgi:hypothetical protein
VVCYRLGRQRRSRAGGASPRSRTIQDRLKNLPVAPWQG